jgi:hypothetical protein
MSTTTEKATACQYSGVDKKRGIVFQISAGRVDIGASISFLSQYPGEAEYLMPPLSCLEASPAQAPLFESCSPMSCCACAGDGTAVGGAEQRGRGASQTLLLRS